MTTCQDADVLAAALSVGAIDPADQDALGLHLAGCADCRRVAGEYMAAAARLPLALEPVAPSPELRGRLMRAVYAEAAQAAASRAAAAPAPWWQRAWRFIPASRGLTVAAAGAAAVLIAVSSWALVTRGGGPAAPVAVTLSATGAAPHAHAELTVQPGDGVAVLTASGLPSPASLRVPGGVYEVWLIAPNAQPVAAGYLSLEPDGSWSGAIRGRLGSDTAVAATIEPPGGSATPTGAMVLEGPLHLS